MAWLFAVNLFLSAALLFAIQPMMGKVTLPKFGGGPAVWNTCMVFYQAVLLAGYAYAHFAPQRLGPAAQRRLHVVLLFLPVVLVPLGWLIWPFAAAPLGMAENWAPPATGFPAPFVLLVLLATVGLPFFVLSTSAPLLQKWFAATGRPGANDPYFLYAASNLGSLIALLSYPFLVERLLSLTAQGWIWLAGYIVVAALVATCMFLALGEDRGSRIENRGSRIEDRIEAEAILDPRSSILSPEDPRFSILSPQGRPDALQRFFWVARAFVPSSLMLGLTTHFTTEIAPVPLLWVLPLAVYLVSFIIAFSRLPVLGLRFFSFLMPPAVLLLSYLLLSETKPPDMAIAFAVHLGVLFIIATALHGAIAESRPDTRHLTEFFLWIALGGVLGGSFNALLAPLAFPGIAEYPLAIILAALLLPPLVCDTPLKWQAATDLPLLAVLGLMGPLLLWQFTGGEWPLARWLEPRGLGLAAAAVLYVLVGIFPVVLAKEERLRWAIDWLVPLAVCCLALAIQLVPDVQDHAQQAAFALAAMVGTLTIRAALDLWHQRWWQLLYLIWPLFGAILLFDVLLLRRAAYPPEWVEAMFRYGLPLVLAAAALDRPLRFGLGVGAVFLVGTLAYEVRTQGNVLYRERSFFGTCKVLKDEKDGIPVHYLVHGTIMHGLQAVNHPELRRSPTSYYHQSGPLGDLLLHWQREKRKPPIAVLGLGTGSMAAWAKPGQEMVFFEIDPAVVRIARAPALFTYLTDAEERGVYLREVVGDGRVMINQEPDGQFGLILADAFSSDAIPTHLMTREALRTFLRKLAPGGVIAYNISNRYLDLEPVLGNLAADAGLVAYHRFDTTAATLKSAADWVLLARRPEDLAGVTDLPGWKPVPADPSRRLWTDDYSNLLDVYRWKRD